MSNINAIQQYFLWFTLMKLHSIILIIPHDGLRWESQFPSSTSSSVNCKALKHPSNSQKKFVVKKSNHNAFRFASGRHILMVSAQLFSTSHLIWFCKKFHLRASISEPKTPMIILWILLSGSFLCIKSQIKYS